MTAGKGRKKVEIDLIKHSSSRMVCFSKRRKGLFKKVEELSILTGAKVSVLAFSQAGKMYCSDRQTLDSLLLPQLDMSSERTADYQCETGGVEAVAGKDMTLWFSKVDVQSMTFEELQQFERAISEYKQMHLAKNCYR